MSVENFKFLGHLVGYASGGGWRFQSGLGGGEHDVDLPAGVEPSLVKASRTYDVEVGHHGELISLRDHSADKVIYPFPALPTTRT